MRTGTFYSLKRLLRYLLSNRLRFVLTELGLVLSVVLFLTAYCILDSVYLSKFDGIAFWKTYGITDITYTPEKSATDMKLQEEYFGSEYLLFRYSGAEMLSYPVVVNGEEMVFALSVYETNNNFTGNLILDVLGNIHASEMLSGSGITREQVANGEDVVVIGRTLADLLYPDGAVGRDLKIPYEKLIDLGNGTVYDVSFDRPYRIIGVYDDSEIMDYESASLYGTLNFTIYIPYGNNSTEESSERLSGYRYIFTDSSLSEEETNHFIEGAYHLSEYTDYGTQYRTIEAEYSDFKRIINIITVCIILMSVLMISETMIFSVKERLPEFGIKRALGATMERIWLELVVEMLVLAVIGFVTALILSLLISNVFFYLNHFMEWFENITFHLAGKNLLVSFLLTLVTAFNSLLIPMVYIDRSSIVETIRFE